MRIITAGAANVIMSINTAGAVNVIISVITAGAVNVIGVPLQKKNFTFQRDWLISIA